VTLLEAKAPAAVALPGCDSVVFPVPVTSPLLPVPFGGLVAQEGGAAYDKRGFLQCLKSAKKHPTFIETDKRTTGERNPIISMVKSPSFVCIS
jgi:hypothetical protein